MPSIRVASHLDLDGNTVDDGVDPVTADALATKGYVTVVSEATELPSIRPTGECNNIWCNPPWRAGERWVAPQYNSICTSAFPVFSPVNSWDNFVLTAGHCIDGGSVAKCSLSQCFVPIGGQYSYYLKNGGDAALLRINHSYPTYGAWWAPGIADSLPTRPVEVPPIGAKVCHVGSGVQGDVSGIWCGLVQTTNSPKQWVEGGKFYTQHMTRALGGCIQNGNSGGPTLNPDTGGAVGIVSAGNTGPSGTQNCVGVVVLSENVGNALANLGVVLKTS